MTIAWIIIGMVTAQRLGEVVFARNNTLNLIAKGAQEFGNRHYFLFPLLHSTWLLSLAIWVGVFEKDFIIWPCLYAYLGLQCVRVWIMVSLGHRWTTRIIVLKNTPLVKRGPYRFCKHPNYILVGAEIALLPIAFGAWQIAIIFSILNIGLLFHRVRIENIALSYVNKK